MSRHEIATAESVPLGEVIVINGARHKVVEVDIAVDIESRKVRKPSSHRSWVERIGASDD